ncbi:unnamed protein product [Peronospora farinosa]|uniref:Uncharacterized protein n=1 Tax=Peronospora farinosa TaxID=134698 RepID=A0AAV0SS60_9STRA|nr:unnamed protein product [Peronospora farinosa]CAI5705790.1 unnamed protein product [Peronospora farinosa]
MKVFTVLVAVALAVTSSYADQSKYLRSTAINEDEVIDADSQDSKKNEDKLTVRLADFATSGKVNIMDLIGNGKGQVRFDDIIEAKLFEGDDPSHSSRKSRTKSITQNADPDDDDSDKDADSDDESKKFEKPDNKNSKHVSDDGGNDSFDSMMKELNAFVKGKQYKAGNTDTGLKDKSPRNVKEESEVAQDDPILSNGRNIKAKKILSDEEDPNIQQSEIEEDDKDTKPSKKTAP